MNIQDIENKRVKICSHSLTVKDENNKTQGVVTGIIPWKELRISEQMRYFKNLRESGLWGSEYDLMKYLVVNNGQLVYLQDLRTLENYEKYFKDREGFDSETKRYNDLKDIANKVKEFAIVVPCYVCA